MKIYIDTPMNGWCRLAADTLDHLHVFAKEIGVDRSWFRDIPGQPHYDCVGGMIKNAINAGAVRITREKLTTYMKKHYSPEFL